MADCVVSFALNVVKEYAVMEAKALAEVGDRIMLLKDKLEWLQTFVRDADQKRRSKDSPYIAVWVRQTRDIAFEVEDVLDAYYRKTVLAGTDRPFWNTCFQFLAFPIKKLLLLDNLSKRMNKIEKRLKEISDRKTEYNIQNLGEASVWISSSATNLTGWDDLEEEMFGFDGYEERLRELLIGPSTESRYVISIIGESGSGKSKLATKIYQCEEVQKPFQIRVFLTLPPKYRVTEFLDRLFKMVRIQVPHTGRFKPDQTVHEKLRNALGQCPHLLVLDGIASIADWYIVKAALPDVTNGSRVIIIMQSDCEGVANSIDPSIVAVKIERLNEEMSKKLFVNRVFSGHSHWSWFDETTYGEAVFTLTQGLPLTIVLLASILRLKESQAEWNFVFEQLKGAKSGNALDRVLVLSFDDLPHVLKPCLLYLSALRENKLVQCHKLVRLWVSEGFIEPRKGRTLEEVGQQYLKEMVARCFVRVLNKDSQGDAEDVVVPIPVLAFLQSEARETTFFEVHDEFDVIAPSTVRRLSIQNFSDRYVPHTNLFPKLRSLICDFAPTKLPNPPYNTLEFLHASKFLRVFVLQGLLLKNLPKELGSMIHLRYLSIKKCGLQRLPTSISNLHHLQTLEFKESHAGSVDLGEAFWDIHTLRHIFAKIKPPASMKLKHNLQTLHGLDCSQWDTALLEEAINLRSLELEGLFNSHLEALLGALGKLKFLTHLKLKCSHEAYVPSRIFDIRSLPRLQSLEIDGRMENLQDQESVLSGNISTLPNLTKLILWHSEMCQEIISIIAKFPRLSLLQMGNSSYRGETLVFPEKGFQSLTELHLILDNLEEWRIENSVMPELVRLYFWQCKSLKMIPDGMQYLRKLKEVVVYRSHAIAERIKERGDDYHKVQHLPIIRVIGSEEEEEEH